MPWHVPAAPPAPKEKVAALKLGVHQELMLHVMHDLYQAVLLRLSYMQALCCMQVWALIQTYSHVQNISLEHCFHGLYATHPSYMHSNT